MTTKTTTFTASGTFTAPSTLLTGKVTLGVYGSATVPVGYPVSGGHGGYVGGTLTVSPSGALAIHVPWTSGGLGGTSTGGLHASAGGSSSAVLQTVSGTLTIQIVAGGAGGEGTKYELAAGTGGHPGTRGQGGGTSGGRGASGGTGGAGGSALTGASAGTAGGNASGNSATGTGGVGGNGVNAGGGGGGGYAGGGGGGGAGTPSGDEIEGTGGGGSSYASASVGSPTYTTGANTGAGYVTVTYTYADAPAAPLITSPTTGASIDVNGAAVPVVFTYRKNTDSGTLNGYVCAVRATGGSVEYFNAATGTLQATRVVNSCSSSTTTFTIPGSLFTAGTPYRIALATQESHYTLLGTFAGVTITPYSVPDAPTLTSAVGGTTTATLTWTAPSTDGGSPVTSYDVFKGTSSGGETSTPVNTSPIPATDTSYIVSGLSSGTTYFTVKALNAAGSSVASNELSATTTTPPTFVSAPTLEAVAGTDPVSGVPIVTLTVTNTQARTASVAGTILAVVLRSDGKYVIGASPTTPQTVPTANVVTVVDRMPPYGVPVTYIAFVTYGGTESGPSLGQTVPLMQAPDTTTLYNRLGYAQTEDTSGELEAWLSGIGTMFQGVDSLAAEQVDTEGNVAPGWSQLLDVDRCPTEALPWLGQFLGVRVNTLLRDDQQRYQIKNPQGFARGTPAAIVAAANQYLRPGYTATLVERDTSPYHLTVKIPQVAIAGLSTYSSVPLTYSTYSAFAAAYATYGAMWKIPALITAAVDAALPAGIFATIVYD